MSSLSLVHIQYLLHHSRFYSPCVARFLFLNNCTSQDPNAVFSCSNGSSFIAAWKSITSLYSSLRNYAKSVGQCLQEHVFLVEMLYLQVESGLTQALQDVHSNGSPLCVRIEQTNVTLSSCTVIIFSESLKIHRNMPREQALELIMAEIGHGNGAQQQHDPAEAAARATELTEDYLERVNLECHAVPCTTRHLLYLMAEGLHLYPEELDDIAEYLHNRQVHLQGEHTQRSPAELGDTVYYIRETVQREKQSSEFLDVLSSL